MAAGWALLAICSIFAACGGMPMQNSTEGESPLPNGVSLIGCDDCDLTTTTWEMQEDEIAEDVEEMLRKAVETVQRIMWWSHIKPQIPTQ